MLLLEVERKGTVAENGTVLCLDLEELGISGYKNLDV